MGTTIKNKILLTLYILLALVMLVGCTVGNFESTEDYIETFDEVVLISSDREKDSYDFGEYFYSEKNLKDFSGELVNEEDYIYFYLPFTKEEKVTVFGMWLKSDIDVTLELEFFTSSSLINPDNIRLYTDPYSELDGEGIERIIDYDDYKNPFFTQSVTLNAGKWGSFASYFDSSVLVSKDEYIVIRINNNSGLGCDKGLKPAKLVFTDLVINTETE